MNSATIVAELVKKVGGKAKDWKRETKFKFKDSDEFETKNINGLSLDDIGGDIEEGTVPSSGICRVFIHRYTEHLNDTQAFVITSEDDNKIVYLSAASD